MDERSRPGLGGGAAGRGGGPLRHQLRVYWLLVRLYRRGGDRDDPKRAVDAARALLARVHPIISRRYRRFLQEHDGAASATRAGHTPRTPAP